IVITASHNPAKYNGYKVYGKDGCQITLEAATNILSCIEKVRIFADTKTTDFKKAVNAGQVQWIKDGLMQSFIEKTKACTIHPELLKQTDLKVIYTPLNGTGNKPVRQALTACGFKNICVVPAQEKPDGSFSTCPKPNPEERAAFHVALKLAAQNPADILLATDPDCDRVGIAVRDNRGEYVLLTGNETGCLLLEYILSQKQAHHLMPKNPVAIKTIVTTAMAYTIASEYNVQIIDTLTGFKFIGEQIGRLEQKGEENRYVFGFEESYGYLLGTYVRDKDAVSASVLICEMAAYYKKQGMTLLDALIRLYQKYGCWKHKLLSFSFEGEEGQAVMQKIENAFRNDQYNSFAGLAVDTKTDYLYSVSYNKQIGGSKTLSLPKSNVLVFELEQGAEVVLRPSGTEPKFKCYLTAKGDDIKSATDRLNALEEDVRHIIGHLSNR
ncbi:MAG: phospho-sugar mutase, partial [Ethanoligenens sp.]